MNGDRAIAAFLHARYDEQEELAKQAAAESPTPWWRGDKYGVRSDRPDDRQVYDATEEVVVYDEGAPGPAVAAYIAQHGPDVALADIEAKRKILWLTERAITSESGAVRLHATWTLRALAVQFSEHPDHCGAWNL